jgi:hypothetical protein
MFSADYADLRRRSERCFYRFLAGRGSAEDRGPRTEDRGPKTAGEGLICRQRVLQFKDTRVDGNGGILVCQPAEACGWQPRQFSLDP